MVHLRHDTEGVEVSVHPLSRYRERLSGKRFRDSFPLRRSRYRDRGMTTTTLTPPPGARPKAAYLMVVVVHHHDDPVPQSEPPPWVDVRPGTLLR